MPLSKAVFSIFSSDMTFSITNFHHRFSESYALCYDWIPQHPHPVDFLSHSNNLNTSSDTLTIFLARVPLNRQKPLTLGFIDRECRIYPYSLPPPPPPRSDFLSKLLCMLQVFGSTGYLNSNSDDLCCGHFQTAALLSRPLWIHCFWSCHTSSTLVR